MKRIQNVKQLVLRMKAHFKVPHSVARRYVIHHFDSIEALVAEDDRENETLVDAAAVSVLENLGLVAPA